MGLPYGSEHVLRHVQHGQTYQRWRLENYGIREFPVAQLSGSVLKYGISSQAAEFYLFSRRFYFANNQHALLSVKTDNYS